MDNKRITMAVIEHADTHVNVRAHTFTPAITLMDDSVIVLPCANPPQEATRLAEMRGALALVDLSAIRVVVMGIIWEYWVDSIRACLHNSGYEVSGPLDMARIAAEHGVIFLPRCGVGSANSYARNVVRRLFDSVPRRIVVVAFGRSQTYGGILTEAASRHAVYHYVAEWAVTPHSCSVQFCDAFVRINDDPLLRDIPVDWSVMFRRTWASVVTAHALPLVPRDPMQAWCTQIRTGIVDRRIIVAICTMPCRAWAWIVITPVAVWIARGVSELADDITDTCIALEWVAAVMAANAGMDAGEDASNTSAYALTAPYTCEVVTTSKVVFEAINDPTNIPAHMLRLTMAITRVRYAGMVTIAGKARRDFARTCNEPAWSTKWMHSSCYGAARIACIRANSGMSMVWPPQVWG